MSEIVNNYNQIRSNLPQTIEIIAVSKGKEINDIKPLLASGHLIYGESYVQEALEKWQNLKSTYEGVKLHLLGHLQTNKVKEAVEIFDVIESIDNYKLAVKLKAEMARQNKQLDCFVQINIGNEQQKYGILPQEADDFIKICQFELELPIVGLMAIPPAEHGPAPYFALLKTIAKRHNIKLLSMGMSADWRMAARFGTNFVRIGQAIFGAR
jgi:pyridoxal phosphate enzyme (YggS family)